VGVNSTPRPLYLRGKKPSTHCIERQGGTQRLSGYVRKISHLLRFFLYSLVLCTSCVLGSLPGLSFIMPFVFYSLHWHYFFIFFYSASTSSVLVSLYWLPCILHFYFYLNRNTNFHVPGGIWTRNPSKRSAADPRHRPLGHWDRQSRPPNRLARSESLYRLSYRGPLLSQLATDNH
jgi:hypothetical protein